MERRHILIGGAALALLAAGGGVSFYLRNSVAQEALTPVEDGLFEQDRILGALSEHLTVLHLRAGSASERVVRHHLESPCSSDCRVCVCIGPGLVRQTIASELRRDGAAGWMLLDEGTDVCGVRQRFDECDVDV